MDNESLESFFLEQECRLSMQDEHIDAYIERSFAYKRGDAFLLGPPPVEVGVNNRDKTPRQEHISEETPPQARRGADPSYLVAQQYLTLSQPEQNIVSEGSPIHCNGLECHIPRSSNYTALESSLQSGKTSLNLKRKSIEVAVIDESPKKKRSLTNSSNESYATYDICDNMNNTSAQEVGSQKATRYDSKTTHQFSATGYQYAVTAMNQSLERDEAPSEPQTKAERDHNLGSAVRNVTESNADNCVAPEKVCPTGDRTKVLDTSGSNPATSLLNAHNREMTKPAPKQSNDMNKFTRTKLKRIKIPHLIPTVAAGLPTSPIEEYRSVTDMVGVTGKRSSTSPSNSLVLEVKQRIAKHATTDGRINAPKLLMPQFNSEEELKTESPSIEPISEDSDVNHASFLLHSSSPKSRIVNSEEPRKVSNAKVQPSLSKQKKGAKLQKMTPFQYAQTLQPKIAVVAQNAGKKPAAAMFLQGKNVFYVGQDMQWASETTRGRMDIIVRHGGNLLPTYDSKVITHIVTDGHVKSTLRALGLNSLNQIPEHIPTVTWRWVLSGIKSASLLDRAELDNRLEELVWMHAAFSDRFNAGRKRTIAPISRKGKEKAQYAEDISHISSFTPDETENVQKTHDAPKPGFPVPRFNIGASPPISPPRVTAAGHLPTQNDGSQDPLAEFYAQAKAQTESRWSRPGEGEAEETDNEDDFAPVDLPKLQVPKRGWACDAQINVPCINQDLVDKLQELMELHKSKPGDEDRWRAFAYNKCIRALRNYPKRIQSFGEARTIHGVGEKTAKKIAEILSTGELRRIEFEKTDDVTTTRLFQGIYGVGQSTAFKWYSAGCRTLDDLKDPKFGVNLSAAQLVGISFYEDINDRMPREEAKAIFDHIKPIALDIDPKLFVEIMGSYRRGKSDCGDIDILISRPTDDGATHSGVLSRLLKSLHSAGILTEDLAPPENTNGLEAIYRGLCRLPKEGSRRRRIDFLTVPWNVRGAALLYYTGDDIFNRAMRLKANALGYSLNQRGLFGGVIRDPRDRRVKLNSGTVVASETEEEIFQILGVPWQEPHERVRG